MIKWNSYCAVITERITGKSVVSLCQHPFDDEITENWWKHGNMQCDCNRQTYFLNELGVDQDTYSTRCGDRAYHVLLILNDGTCIDCN